MRKTFRQENSRRHFEQPKISPYLDLTHGLSGVLQQVAIVTSKPSTDFHSRELCLSYLTSAVNFIRQQRKIKVTKTNGCRPLPARNVESSDGSELRVLSNEESNFEAVKLKYYCVLRCCLLHKRKEVRAAGVRLLRYLTRTKDDVSLLIKSNTIPLIVRCIDICIDNHGERVHGIRLARDILHLAPSLFPVGLARCLVAIAREGAKERDRLLRSAQATLNELALLNPAIFIEAGGVSAFLHCILDCSLPRINEAMMSGLLFLLNDPTWRPHCAQFQMILSPFSDLLITKEEKESRLQSSWLASLTALRSWPGLVTLYHPRDQALMALLQLLSLPNDEDIDTQDPEDKSIIDPKTLNKRAIIFFLYDLFRIPIGGDHEEYAPALRERSSFSSADLDSYRLHDGFVVSEAKAILPHVASYRPNLIQNYLALLLYTLMEKGLFQALCNVIVSSSTSLSIKATFLLGELLHHANQNLPLECGSMSHALPILTGKASGPDSDERVKSTQAISALLTMSRLFLSQNTHKGCSLYLMQILNSNQKASPWKLLSSSLRPAKLSKWLAKDHDELVVQTIKDAGVLCEQGDSLSWNWGLIIPVLRWPSSSLSLLEDSVHKHFLRKVLNHFKPSSHLFSRVDLMCPSGKVQAEALLLFCSFLLEIPIEHQDKYLTELLDDVNACLKEVACERPMHDAILSPPKLNTTVSQYYFLAIGALTRSAKGYKFLIKTGIYEQLINVIDTSLSDMYSKLISTSLDYSIDGDSRRILTKILTSGKECSRMYATQLLRVFVRAKVRDFTHWGIELLVTQLHDQSRLVAFAALDVLDEALDDEENLEAVLKAPPSVPHLGDKGQLLLAKMVSSPRGFKSYYNCDCNFIPSLLDRWASSFNLKYAKLMQNSLSESFTEHRRGEDGLYGRRTSSKHVVYDVYLLPHLYGSLTMHKDGFSMLVQHEHIKTLIQLVKAGSVSTDKDVYKLKAAIWGLGHLGRSSSGVSFLCHEDVISALIHLAKSCSVYSVRGTVFHALCLIATTGEGVLSLRRHGWDCVRRNHHEMVQAPFDLVSFNETKTGSVGHQNATLPTRNYHQSESDMDDREKSGFYVDESEEDFENFMIYDLDSYSTTPKKAQTLPHDTKPPTYMCHQRSFSDIAPVLEDSSSVALNHSSQVEWSSGTKKGSKLKSKFMSSIRRRRRSRKRCDSVDSRISNSSSASERLASFLRPGKYFKSRRKSSESAGEDVLDDSGTSRSYSFTEPGGGQSDEESKLRYLESPGFVRPRLSPIASGASLSTVGSKAISEDSYTKGNNAHPQNNIGTKKSAPLKIMVPSFSYHRLRGPSLRRRGVSESGQEEMQTRNSLQDFISSSCDPTLFQNRSVMNASRGIIRSTSGCSEIASLRSWRGIPKTDSSRYLISTPVGGSGWSFNEANNSLVHPSGQCYLGMTVPLNIDDLLHDDTLDRREKVTRMHSHPFNVTQHTKFSVITEASEEPKDDLSSQGENITTVPPNDPSDNVFEYHTKDACIGCSCFFAEEKQPYGDGGTDNDSCISLPNENPPRASVPDRTAMRKEVLRFATKLLIHSEKNHNAENGLLYLKQRLPIAFQDPCLYFEVYSLLSSYTYHLSTRRLLQELFSDITFTKIFENTQEILNSFDPEITEAVNHHASQLTSSSLYGLGPMEHSERIVELQEVDYDDFEGFNMEEDC